MKVQNQTRNVTCIIILKSFDANILESYLSSVKQLAFKVGIPTLNIKGPIRLPNQIKRWTVLRSPHIDKKSREQFEWVVHKRYIEFSNTALWVQQIFLFYLEEHLPLGIGVEVKRNEYFAIPSNKKTPLYERNNYFNVDSVNLQRRITKKETIELFNTLRESASRKENLQ